MTSNFSTTANYLRQFPWINKFWIRNSGKGELPPTIPMGLTNSGLEIAEKLGEVDITTKVKRGDYFNSPQDFIHKFQNKP